MVRATVRIQETAKMHLLYEMTFVTYINLSMILILEYTLIFYFTT